jgi:hypothetical protein
MIIIKNNTYVIVKDYQELMRLKFNKPFEDKDTVLDLKNKISFFSNQFLNETIYQKGLRK